jgi:hypothetical protein
MGPSPSNRPSAPSAPKRPFYLVLALLGAWVFGASGFVDGCAVIGYYKSDHVEPVGGFTEITGNEGRARVAAAADHYADVMNASRKRVFPLAVAAFLLGTVMVAFAARAMSGRKGGRGGLVQVLCVQTALIIATYFLTADVRRAERDLNLTVQIEGLREAQPAKPESEEVIALMQRLVRVTPPVFLSVQVLLRLLILLALTRPRSRAFFAAAEERSLEQ